MTATGKAGNRSSQALVEVVALALVVFAAIWMMRAFVMRATAGSVKESISSIGGDYYFDPGNAPRVMTYRQSQDYAKEGFWAVGSSDKKRFISYSNGTESGYRRNAPDEEGP